MCDSFKDFYSLFDLHIKISPQLLGIKLNNDGKVLSNTIEAVCSDAEVFFGDISRL
jgi:hypothetical protein